MDDQTILHHLEELAGHLGVELRYEAAAGRAGLCVLRGKKVAIIDDSLRVAERVDALASIFADQPTEDIYLPPAVRERLLRSAEREKTGDHLPGPEQEG